MLRQVEVEAILGGEKGIDMNIVIDIELSNPYT